MLRGKTNLMSHSGFEKKQGPLMWLDNLLRDLRFSIRQLLKNPGFAATAIVVLALGIAASVAIFAFVDAALIRPLPYSEPQRLVHVTESDVALPRVNLSYPDYLDWKRMNTVLTSLDAIRLFPDGPYIAG
jgi:macrolide transport system ATP-binding/permease protein